MHTMTPAQLLESLRWRYATKKFDATRKIPADTWKALEESLVLTPSSYGLQPWRFVVVTDPAVRERLRAVSWNQAQVTDCSHHVVFAARADMTEADVDRLVTRTVEVRRVPAEAIAGYRKMMIGDVVKGPRHAWIHEWAARQCYIALGQFMETCAVLGIDACPMEGLDPAKYDEILGLPAQGFRTVVACPAGYRAADDGYASLAKVRFAASDVIRHV